MSTEYARATINEILDPDGKARDLANQIGLSLLQAVREQGDDFAWGPAIAATALLVAAPHDDRGQAIVLAKAFGDAIVDEVSEKWEELVSIRRRFDAGEFDR